MSDIERFRGDTYANEFILKSRKTGLPIDLTGCSFVMTVDPNKSPTSNADNLFQLTGEIIDPMAGRVAFAPTESQANQTGSYYYDIQMVDAVGRKRTIITGKYKFSQDITK